MTPVAHGTFTLERRFKSPVATVYAAWTDLESRARWFVGPSAWRPLRREMDFKLGGHEILQGAFPDGLETFYESRFHAIEPNSRLVFVYDVRLNGALHSVAMASVTFAATAEGGTLMTFTETTAFMDGEDDTAGRAAGTAAHLDRLVALLDGGPFPTFDGEAICGAST